MPNPFVQHIGIWCAEEDESIMEEVMKYISQLCIGIKIKEQLGGRERAIYLKDGSWIKARFIKESCGQRFTSSFIINPKHTSSDLVKKLVYSCTTLGEGGVYVLDLLDGVTEESLQNKLFYRTRYEHYIQNKEN